MSADKMRADFDVWLSSPIAPPHSLSDCMWRAWQSASAAQAREIARLTLALAMTEVREELTGTDDDLFFPSGREMAARLDQSPVVPVQAQGVTYGANDRRHKLLVKLLHGIGMGDGRTGWIEHADEDGIPRRDLLSFDGELIFGFEAIGEHIKRLEADRDAARAALAA